MEIAQVRILRLAAGTGLSLWVSQAVGWDLSFIAPVLTLFILTLPLPALNLKQGVLVLAAMTLSMYSSLLLLPWLLDYPLVGLLLLVLALYWSFYFTAKGGSPVLGNFITVGIAVSTAIGSVNLDATLALMSGLIMNAVIGIVFVWIAHALLPDSMGGGFPGAGKPKGGVEPDLADARWSAFRSLVIVFPIAFWFMLSGASTSYVPVMIKVASMGQQATNEGARLAGRSLIMSTIIGGIGAIIGWNILSIAPTLSIYVLLTALAGLIFGPKIFQGKGLHAEAATWSYAYLTMIVILAPAVMDTASGSSADVAFWSRLLMFALATLYGVAAVYVVDAFRPARTKSLVSP